MKVIFDEAYLEKKNEIINFINNFNHKGKSLLEGQRNSIKLFELDNKTINIKSFRKPNIINKIVYRFFRKSKAERSFYYAKHLISKEIGTPYPVAYAENESAAVFKDSYYVSEHLPYELTYRELVKHPNFPEHERILREFTRFTYDLHEKNIQFLDHSPGNTLIRKEEDTYKFYLVDLNRMNFKRLNFVERMKNFSRLTPKKEMIEVMASEYSKLIDKPESEVFEKMWFFTSQFQEKYHRKHRLKKKLKLK